METKTLNEWLKVYGYTWKAGEERLYKALLNESEAESYIMCLLEEGSLLYV